VPIVVTTEWLRELVPTDLPAKEIGDRLSDVGLAVDVFDDMGKGEARLELEVPTNRGDCWSIIGVARELAATLGLKVKLPPTKLRTSGTSVKSAVAVKVEAPDLCPRYTARVVRGVKVGPSPEWMQRRLEDVGIRPISNVVDVTNYVLVETGQPLHAFDLELLAGERKKAILVRRAAAGEKLPLLDETTKELSTDDLVIATPGRAVALAGIMGGADTEIRDSTTDVLIESAEFNQISTRRTARRHGVSSESSVRFEHGVDPVGVEAASRRAAYLLAEVAGGKVAPGVAGPDPKWKAPKITLRHSRVSRLLCGSSATIPDRDIRRTLKALGLEFVRAKKSKGDVVSTWLAPPWRRELAVEVDLIEEVARIYGYDRLPGKPTMRVFPVTPHPIFEARRRARDVLTALGYTEVCGASFFSAARAARAARGGADAHRVRNPARAGEGSLRTSLVPSLLAAKLANQNNGARRVRIFEVAPVCTAASEGASERIAILDDGPEGAGGGDSEDALLRVKGALEAVARRLDGSGAGAKALAEAQEVALLPKAEADAWGLKTVPAIVEADLAAFAEGIGHAPRATDLPVFPGIARDAALVMPEEKTWAEIERAAAELAHEWRSAPEFVEGSIFRDAERIGAGRKSIAFRVVYRAPDRTLTDDDVKGPHAEFVSKLCVLLQAQVRS
jgi:phenylalanyl-tRNA synthetase beta chain